MSARPFSSLLLLACVSSALVLGAATSAVAAPEEAPVSFQICEPPISTCRTFPSPLESLRPEIAPLPFENDCPKGYDCRCVPSCPDCKDCAAQVCLRDPSRECRTACDCAPGLGCFDGQCIAGFAPVYCCDSGLCPAGEMCQFQDGGMGTCEPDPSCRERAEKVSRAIEYAVERTNRCEVDRDCVLVDTGTDCGGTCGAYINEDRVEHFEKARAWFDRKICGDYQKDGCPFATPGCLVTVGRCVDNRCEGVPIQIGPPPIPLPEEQGSGSGAILDLERAR